MIEVNAHDTQIAVKLTGGTFTRRVKAGNYSFLPGINLLAGTEGSGNDGLSLLLSGRCGFNDCTVTADGREVRRRELAEISCLVGHAPPHSDRVPFRRLAERGLRKNRTSLLTFDDLAGKFLLTSARYGRRLSYMGNERWRASLAVGYAYGKSVFCTPFLSAEGWEKLYRYALKPYLELLRADGMTVILAAENESCGGDIADNIIHFENEG